MQNREYVLNDGFNGKIKIIFNDDNIIIKERKGDRVYSYSDVSDVKITKTNSKTVFFKLKEPNCAVKRACYIEITDEGARKELLEYLLVPVRENAAKKLEEYQKEYVYKCNTCGNIFTYTGADLEENKRNSSSASLAGGLSIISGLFGTRYDMYEQEKRANTLESKVIDYSRCPKCNSKNIVEIDSNQTNNTVKEVNSSNDTNIEKLKQFKELLDMGAITQEDYDKKKNELLNL